MKILLTVFSLLLSGCANIPQAMDSDIQQTTDLIDAALSENKTKEVVLADAPDDIMQELSDSLANEISTGVFANEYLSEPTFDLSVSNAPANAFFMGLVKDSDENMLVHPSVVGDITLDLKNVTISEVMELVRDVYGYEYKRKHNGYIVLPPTLVSKVFHVNYLNISRGGETNMTVSSGQQSSGDSGDSSSSGASASTNVVTSTKFDFWSGLKETLLTIVGNDKGRTVIVDPHANLVVVKAFPSELRDVEAYLVETQANLQRQVILEAKIIEVTLNENFQSGVDWAALAQSGSSNAAMLAQVGLNNGTASSLDSTGAFSTANVLSSSQSSLSNLFTYGVSAGNFAAIIRLLGTQGDVQVLSSPKISTINNQKAVIKVGEDEYFVTGISSSTSDTTGSGSSTTADATIERFFSGIALDVTPQISQNKDVILHIHPSVTDVSTQTKIFTVNGQTQSLPLAFSKIRESDTIIKAKSGQVVVIGGLMQNTTSDVGSSVPGLSDVPIIGSLFGQKEKSTTRSELIILLKPLVVDDDNDWSNVIGASQQRIRALRQKQQAQ